jgi:SagB-type dehydrogenase family enzyme
MNMRRIPGSLLCILVLSGLLGCVPVGTPVPTPSLTTPEVLTPLPQPTLVGALSLEETLVQRRSVREFTVTPLSPIEIGQLLWAAQGVTHERGYRSAPSAGALYPLEIYVATADGVFHYRPEGHGLAVLRTQDVRRDLFQAALRQEAIRDAPAVFVFTAVYARTAQKYGGQRSPRYVHLEAGHAAQNLLLEAVALGLGAVPVGAFEDQKIQEVLGLPANHEPLYLIPVGHPH